MKSEKGSERTKWVFGLLFVFLLLLGLGSMRLYGVHLEHRLGKLTRLVDEAQERNLLLRQELASLLSPARVYSYAHAELGMGYADRIMVCRVSPQADLVSPKESGSLNLLGRVARLVGREASAGD